MRATAATLLAAVALASAASARAAAAQPAQAAARPAPRSPAPRSPGIGAGAEPAAVARARADSARLPYTAADVRFMSSMIGHHAQAITMARLAPARAASPSVRTLAERIVSAQHDEIGTMQQWLRDRRQPVPEPAAAGPAAADGHDGHAGHGAAAGAAMPGMLTDAELGQLARARGPEFDRLFLTFMIRHHRGAVAMVTQLFGTYGAGQDETVFKFASDVNVDQTTEIARMQRMLADLLLGAP